MLKQADAAPDEFLRRESVASAACEGCNRNGGDAKVRAGIIKEFTSISDPYEAPENLEMRIDMAELTPDMAAHRILIKLESLGFIK